MINNKEYLEAKRVIEKYELLNQNTDYPIVSMKFNNGMERISLQQKSDSDVEISVDGLGKFQMPFEKLCMLTEKVDEIWKYNEIDVEYMEHGKDMEDVLNEIQNGYQRTK